MITSSATSRSNYYHPFGPLDVVAPNLTQIFVVPNYIFGDLLTSPPAPPGHIYTTVEWITITFWTCSTKFAQRQRLI